MCKNDASKPYLKEETRKNILDWHFECDWKWLDYIKLIRKDLLERTY